MVSKWWLLLAGLLLAACGGRGETAVSEPTAAAPTAVAVSLMDLGDAPEITNETWINAAAPVTLASQQGKVVLIEFWTFGCINCQRVIPFIRDWHARYSGDDFAVISVHYPEFSYERDIDNVREAVQRFDIEYPVAIDNDRVTWRAYNQRYWPTTYLVDKNGRIRFQHIGEFTRGSDKTFEAAIEQLLAEPDPS